MKATELGDLDIQQGHPDLDIHHGLVVGEVVFSHLLKMGGVEVQDGCWNHHSAMQPLVFAHRHLYFPTK